MLFRFQAAWKRHRQAFINQPLLVISGKNFHKIKKKKKEKWRKWTRASNGMLSWGPQKEELFATHLSTASYQIMSLQFTVFFCSSTHQPLHPSPPLSAFVISCRNDGIDIQRAEKTSAINQSIQHFFILPFCHSVVHVWVCAHLLHCP